MSSLQEIAIDQRIIDGAVEQRFEKSLHSEDRRSQFMADIRQKFASDTFESLHRSEVAGLLFADSIDRIGERPQFDGNFSGRSVRNFEPPFGNFIDVRCQIDDRGDQTLRLDLKKDKADRRDNNGRP